MRPTITQKTPNFPSYLQAHLAEIRVRLVYSLLSWLLCFLCVYSNSTQIIFFIVKPMCYATALAAYGSAPPNGVDWVPCAPRLQFIYTNVTEAFYATLESALIVSFVCILPFLCYQSLCFLMPGLYARESSGYSLFILYTVAYLAAVTGAVLAGVLPAFYRFLLLFSVGDSLLQIHLEARIAPYLSWVFTTLLYCVCASLLPPLLYLCLRQGWLSPQGLIKNRKITSYFLLVTAALVSPADLISQLAATACLFVLLECVIWLAIYKRL